MEELKKASNLYLFRVDGAVPGFPHWVTQTLVTPLPPLMGGLGAVAGAAVKQLVGCPPCSDSSLAATEERNWQQSLPRRSVHKEVRGRLRRACRVQGEKPQYWHLQFQTGIKDPN